MICHECGEKMKPGEHACDRLTALCYLGDLRDKLEAENESLRAEVKRLLDQLDAHARQAVQVARLLERVEIEMDRDELEENDV